MNWAVARTSSANHAEQGITVIAHVGSLYVRPTDTRGGPQAPRPGLDSESAALAQHVDPALPPVAVEEVRAPIRQPPLY